YNEAVKDLLSPGKDLILREVKQGNVSVGLTQHNTYSAEEDCVQVKFNQTKCCRSFTSPSFVSLQASCINCMRSQRQ
ncbi:hypothetical protein KI387_033346, partial [Taxus chinensis]